MSVWYSKCKEDMHKHLVTTWSNGMFHVHVACNHTALVLRVRA